MRNLFVEWFLLWTGTAIKLGYFMGGMFVVVEVSFWVGVCGSCNTERHRPRTLYRDYSYQVWPS